MSIDNQLNRHIETKYTKPNEQSEAVRSHFSQEKYKDFLRKIRDYKDFSTFKSNDIYQMTVREGELKIKEIVFCTDERPVGRFFPLRHVWQTYTWSYWPQEYNIVIFLDEEDHVNVNVNDVVTDLDKALKFLDYALFESN